MTRRAYSVTSMRFGPWLGKRLRKPRSIRFATSRQKCRSRPACASGSERFPRRLEKALVELRGLGASLLAYPGLRLLYASFPLAEQPSTQAVDDAFSAVAKVASAAGGSYVCEAAPSWAKAGRDMFGESAGLVPIVRALKQRFDPSGVLNPGRLAGRI